MATVLNTLYPPQVSTFMDAFVNTENAVVYYSLSPYNESTGIKRVHVSVVNQLNNENALNLVSGIMVSDVNYDTVSGKYYIVIPTDYLTGGEFNINQFYKVQLRFDCYDGTDAPTPQTQVSNQKNVTSYLLNYQDYFSEWSSVCLIRPILQPKIVLRSFDGWTESRKISFNKGLIPVSGKLYFGDGNNNETETMQSYCVEVLSTDDETLMTTSTIYTGGNVDPNVINTKVDLQSLDTSSTTEFQLKISITTKNQYTLSKTYDFQIADFISDDNFSPTFSTSVDNDNGIVTVSVKNSKSVFGTLYIKRASSVSKFKDWEIMYSHKVSETINLTLEDNTVGSLTWYRYAVQLENSKGGLSKTYTSNTILPDFYDAILSRENQQIALRYNYKVSSFKPVVNRSKVDTLGGQYPKFAENAILNYKQFSISGTISGEMDAYQRFLAKDDVYSLSPSINVLRNNYLTNHEEIKDLTRNDMQDWDTSTSSNYPAEQFPSETSERFLTTTQNDWMWEREFREQLMTWLNNGEPKLYRSMAEGAMAVMLTDISLTPKDTLGRMLWDFSATVYEIAEADSFETLDTLGIYTRTLVDDENGNSDYDDGSQEEYVEVVKASQMYDYTVPSTGNVNLVDILSTSLQEKYAGVLETKKPDDLYLKNIKIFFTSKPNLFVMQGNDMTKYSSFDTLSSSQLQSVRKGYRFSLQASKGEEKIFFVNERGYYQIPDSLDITALYFPDAGDVVTIEYTMVYKEKNSSAQTIQGSTVERILVGQETGVFSPQVFQGESIRKKYYFTHSDSDTGETYYEQMQYWKGICVDVTPYAMVRIQYEKDSEYRDYLVGGTGVLHMLKNVKVQDLCFLGRRMKKVDISRQRYLAKWEYVEDPGEYDQTSDISSPKENTVYQISENKKIFYNGSWYEFKDMSAEDVSNDQETGSVGLAVVPVEGSINYYGNVVKVVI